MISLTLLLASTLSMGPSIAPSIIRGDPAWNHASVGAYAVNTATGETVMDENGEKSLIPASCMKVVTTAAALQILGPDTRFTTHLQYDGTVDQGILHGNLYIHGGGDPCLGSDRVEGVLSWEKQIEAWVDAVQKLGIKKIEGKVIGDASRWEKALAAPSWSWEDLGNYYGAGACALSFHENFYTLYFKPAKEGEKAEIIRQDPPISNLSLQNEVKTGAVGSGDNACVYGAEFSPVQYVRGTVAAGVPEFAIKGSIPDPAEVSAKLLTQGLESKGISVANHDFPGKKRIVFHTTFSPTVREIVYWTNQKSINLYAEHLLKKIGEVVLGEGSTEAGRKSVTDFWRSQKIDLEGFNMADGSGLSRKNLITARQLVSILKAMKKSKHFPDLMNSLPSQTDRVRAKTGSMSQVRGYAGYADDIAFAIIVNQCLDPQLHQKLKQFLSEAEPFKLEQRPH